MKLRKILSVTFLIGEGMHQQNCNKMHHTDILILNIFFNWPPIEIHVYVVNKNKKKKILSKNEHNIFVETVEIANLVILGIKKKKSILLILL